MRVAGSAPSARPAAAAAAHAGGPSFAGSVHGAGAVAVAEPPRSSTSHHAGPSHGTQAHGAQPHAAAPGENYSPRSMQDRVVTVSGLNAPKGGKVVMVLLIGAIVAAAAWFLFNR
jgi:hypothetical protein